MHGPTCIFLGQPNSFLAPWLLQVQPAGDPTPNAIQRYLGEPFLIAGRKVTGPAQIHLARKTVC
jgi:hypothetical protein